MARFVKEPARRIPVCCRYDVVIAGGGPGGIGAAVAAARAGAKTLLIERAGFLGGMSTGGLVPCFAPFNYTGGKEPVYRGIALEVLKRVWAAGGGGFRTGSLDWPTTDNEILKRIYDEMVEEAGVDVLFFTLVSDVLKSGRTVKGVVIENKAGRQAVEGKTFIDATGDADLAVRAGVPCHKGGAKGEMQGVSLCFTVAGVEAEKWWTFYRKRFKTNGPLTVWLQECQAKGTLPRVPDSEYRMISQHKLSASVMDLNFGHVFGIDGTDPAQVSRAMVFGRRLAHNFVAFARKRMTGWKDARIVSTASLLGVRETRRIRGRVTATMNDFHASRHFPDDIAVCDYPIDVHASSTSRRDGERVFREMETLAQPPGKTYGVPFRSLVPKTLDNLLVVGRSISTDRTLQGSSRIMPICFATGEAAGLASAMAIRSRKAPANVDTSKLRAALRKAGARID